MRILLDECVPVRLARHLPGHTVQTVSGAGWLGTKNGELLRRAAANYEAFITVDQGLAAHPGRPPELAIITLQAPTNRLDSLLPLVPRLLETLASVQPGQSLLI